METYAKVILASRAPQGKVITTFEICYQRFILAEVNTHRALSKSSASSRAIPIAKMISQVWREPAMPIHWGQNQSGMQANVELTGWRKVGVKLLWRLGGKLACGIAWGMSKLGAHKQIANRRLEADQWMRTIITGTEWDNLWELRDHPDAQPEFRDLVQKMRAAQNAAPIQDLKWNEWHMPYTDTKLPGENGVNCKISSARCARVSYLTHDGNSPDEAKDVALFERLAGSRPLHASPLEHVARPEYISTTLFPEDLPTKNFKGWVQFRSLVEANL